MATGINVLTDCVWRNKVLFAIDICHSEKGRGELRINRIQINITITKLQRVTLSNRCINVRIMKRILRVACVAKLIIQMS